MQIEIKGNCIVLDSKALSKIHSVALIAIIVVTTVSGSVAYVLWSGQVQPGETIRIGICDDLVHAQWKRRLASCFVGC